MPICMLEDTGIHDMHVLPVSKASLNACVFGSIIAVVLFAAEMEATPAKL